MPASDHHLIGLHAGLRLWGGNVRAVLEGPERLGDLAPCPRTGMHRVACVVVGAASKAVQQAYFLPNEKPGCLGGRTARHMSNILPSASCCPASARTCCIPAVSFRAAEYIRDVESPKPISAASLGRSRECLQHEPMISAVRPSRSDRPASYGASAPPRPAGPARSRASGPWCPTGPGTPARGPPAG